MVPRHHKGRRTHAGEASGLRCGNARSVVNGGRQEHVGDTEKVVARFEGLLNNRFALLLIQRTWSITAFRYSEVHGSKA